MNHQLKIDTSKVKRNIDLARKGREVCLMVKANCYGLGDDALKNLIEMGYRFFGVSTLEEALNVKKYRKEAKVLIVSYVELDDIEICSANDITITVYDFKMLDYLNDDVKFHLKIDTNMGRLGFQMDELSRLNSELVSRNLKPEGIFSHLACACDEEKTVIATNNFKQALNTFSDFNFRYVHLNNSYGSLNNDTDFDNLIRLGIGMWGYAASSEEANSSRKQFEPALSLELTVSHVKEYSGYVSYDHVEEVSGIVYTVPIGYHDGFYRKLMGYHIDGIGRIVGKVNMCQHLVLKDDETRLLQRGERYKFFTESELYEVCDYIGISTYEFLVALSPRIKRTFISD